MRGRNGKENIVQVNTSCTVGIEDTGHDNKYANLARVLVDALEQSSRGKGKERHATDEPFEDQKICVMNRWLRGSPVAGALFQATKKCFETAGFSDPDRAIHELRGAINYIAAAIILLEEIGSEMKREEKLPRYNPTLTCDEVCDDCSTGSPECREAKCRFCKDLYTPVAEYPCKKCFRLPFKPHFRPVDGLILDKSTGENLFD